MSHLDEELLQLLVGVVDAELLEAVTLEALKAEDVEAADAADAAAAAAPSSPASPSAACAAGSSVVWPCCVKPKLRIAATLPCRHTAI